MIKHPERLVVSLVVCFLAAAAGSAVTVPAIGGWYETLAKPAVPNWVFGPVWTTLFFLMGVSLYLVWLKARGRAKLAFGLFAAQLALNVLWSVLFFGLQSPLLGLVEIPVLWVSILLTTAAFYRIDKRAAYLLVPYLVWVAFAAFLNYSVWVMNA